MKKEELQALVGDSLSEEVFNSTLTKINEHVDTVRDNHFESKKEEIRSTLTGEVRGQIFKDYGFENEDAFKTAKSTYESSETDLTRKVGELTTDRDKWKADYEAHDTSLKEANGRIFQFERKSEISKQFDPSRVDDVFDLARARKTEENKWEDIYTDLLKNNPSWAINKKGRTTTPRVSQHNPDRNENVVRDRFGRIRKAN